VAALVEVAEAISDVPSALKRAAAQLGVAEGIGDRERLARDRDRPVCLPRS